jgi:16S rRNA (adenine1518-N6/adenine1519-N6)-dimethyltransferase
MSRDGGRNPDDLPPLGEVVRSLELSARKSLGQNLFDLNLTRIARSAGPPAGKTVVEVGPGPGG